MSKDRIARPAPEKDSGKPDGALGALDDGALKGVSGGNLGYMTNAEFHRRFRLVDGRWVER